VEERAVLLVSTDGSHQEGRFIISGRPPWSLRLEWAAGELEAVRGDLFECLSAIRRELDPHGIKVCCAGARSDVNPSGMGRQMGGGRRAYVHRDGERPTTRDLVDIFDSADVELVATVAEQEAAAVGRRRE
jgi:hypothetical protein